MDLPLTLGLLTHAQEKENEAFIFSSWNGLYPHMMMGQMKFQSFSDYKKELIKPSVNLTKKTSEEIIAEFSKVIKQHEVIANKPLT